MQVLQMPRNLRRRQRWCGGASRGRGEREREERREGERREESGERREGRGERRVGVYSYQTHPRLPLTR